VTFFRVLRTLRTQVSRSICNSVPTDTVGPREYVPGQKINIWKHLLASPLSSNELRTMRWQSLYHANQMLGIDGKPVW
jgi:hypothetical protein